MLKDLCRFSNKEFVINDHFKQPRRLLRPKLVSMLAAVTLLTVGFSSPAIAQTTLAGQDSAQQLINSGRVTGGSEPMAQLKAWADGSPRVIDGRSCNIDGVVLRAVAHWVVTEHHSINISSINRYCTNESIGAGTSSYHYKNGGGHAMDINIVDGVQATGNTAQDRALVVDFANSVLKPAGVGQPNCRTASPLILPEGVRQVNDDCTHNHLEYDGSAPDSPTERAPVTVYESASNANWHSQGMPVNATSFASMSMDGVKYVYSINNGYVFEAASNNSWNNLNTGVPAQSIAVTSLNEVKYLYSVNQGNLFESASNNSWTAQYMGITGQSVSAMTMDGVKYVYTINSGKVFEAASNNNWKNLNTNISAQSIAAISNGSTKFVYSLQNGNLFESASSNSWTAQNMGISGTDVAAVAMDGVKYVYTANNGMIFEAASNNSWINQNSNVSGARVSALGVGGVKVIYSSS